MPRQKPIRVKIAGNDWTVRRARLKNDYGRCRQSPREIVIAINTNAERQRRTLIHETIHASAWDLSEECVERLTTDIVAALRACGDWFGAARGTDAIASNQHHQKRTQQLTK